MELRIKINKKEEIERFLTLLNLGILTALKKEAITIEEAEYGLYTPYSCSRLEKIGVNQDVIDLIELGCELEDIESLLPDKLHANLENLSLRTLNVLKSIPKSQQGFQKWIES